MLETHDLSLTSVRKKKGKESDLTLRSSQPSSSCQREHHSPIGYIFIPRSCGPPHEIHMIYWTTQVKPYRIGAGNNVSWLRGQSPLNSSSTLSEGKKRKRKWSHFWDPVNGPRVANVSNTLLQTKAAWGDATQMQFYLSDRIKAPNDGNSPSHSQSQSAPRLKSRVKSIQEWRFKSQRLFWDGVLEGKSQLGQQRV